MLRAAVIGIWISGLLMLGGLGPSAEGTEALRPSALPRLELGIEECDLARMESALPHKLRVPATLSWGDSACTGRVNFSGSGSLLRDSRNYKFRVGSGPRFHGLRAFTIVANAADSTRIRELIAHEMMTLIGLEAYQVRPVQLFVNNDSLGIRLCVEAVDANFLERVGLDPSGRFYKLNLGIEALLGGAEGESTSRRDREHDQRERSWLTRLRFWWHNRWAKAPAPDAMQREASARQARIRRRRQLAADGGLDIPDLVASLRGERLQHAFENLLSDDPCRADGAAFLERLTTTPEREMETWLRQTIDIDRLIDWYASMVWVANRDFVGRNFLLYRSPESRMWAALPWDVDQIMKQNELPLIYGSRASPSYVGGYNLLVERLLSVPALQRRYCQRMEAGLSGPWNASAVDSLIDHWSGAVHGVDSENPRVAATRATLTEFFAQRRELLSAAIRAHSPPPWVVLSINEGVRGSAGGVEIYNRGTAGVPTQELFLSDSREALRRWPLDGEELPAHGAKWIDLDLQGETVTLCIAVAPDSTVVVDSLSLAPWPHAAAVGRYPDGHGSFRALEVPTPGIPNTWRCPADLQLAVSSLIHGQHEALEGTMRVVWEYPGTLTLDLSGFVAGRRMADGAPLWQKNSLDFTGGVIAIPLATLPLQLDVERAPVHLELSLLGPGREQLARAEATLYQPPPPGSGLCINELCARNTGALRDAWGEAEDWVELWNAGPQPLNTAGYYLSDKAEELPLRWALPELHLEAGAFVLIWLDNDPQQGELHANFSLRREGEELTLTVRVRSDTVLVDRVAYGPQRAGQSFGRFPDGGTSWRRYEKPTPRMKNLRPREQRNDCCN